MICRVIVCLLSLIFVYGFAAAALTEHRPIDWVFAGGWLLVLVMLCEPLVRLLSHRR
jgi:hypothetical protein